MTAVAAELPTEWASLDLHQLGDDALEQLVQEVAVARARVEAMWLRVVGAVEQRGVHRRHGWRDVAAYVADLTGDRRAAARRDVELATKLSAAPVVAEAVTHEGLSKAKAAELVHAAELPVEVQQGLVLDALGTPVEAVAAAVRRARLEHGAPEPPIVPAATLTRSHDRVHLEATVDLVDGEILQVALQAAANALALPADLPFAERQACALVAIARHYLEHADDLSTTRIGRPHVLVLVDLEVLTAASGGWATLASGAVITGDQARRLAEDANISRILTKGSSEPLDVGRSTRSVAPAIAKAVIARDRHCRYRGCTSPPWACDIHHLMPWARGGQTSLSNLGLLCWHHHDHVHRQGPHRLAATADGRWAIEPRQVGA